MRENSIDFIILFPYCIRTESWGSRMAESPFGDDPWNLIRVVPA